MSRVTLNIASLLLTLEGRDSVGLVMSLPGWTTFRSTAWTEWGLTARLDAEVTPPDSLRILHCFSIADGEAECRFAVDAEGVYYYLFGQDEALRLDRRTPQIAECTPIVNPDVLRFALWLAYGMMGTQLGRVPIHSSAVVYRGQAVLCLGESGTGKSTHTRLWLDNIEGCHLLNDDSPILRITPDGVLACGSPWSGKTHCYLNEQYPVAALLRLEQRPENSICRLPVLHAFGAVQPSLPPAMAHDEWWQAIQVSLAGAIVASTSVYRMGCRPDAAAARLSHDTIYECANV